MSVRNVLFFVVMISDGREFHTFDRFHKQCEEGGGKAELTGARTEERPQRYLQDGKNHR